MKRAFDVKLKAVFIIFKGLSAVKNCLRPESAPLRIDCVELCFYVVAFKTIKKTLLVLGLLL